MQTKLLTTFQILSINSENHDSISVERLGKGPSLSNGIEFSVLFNFERNRVGQTHTQIEKEKEKRKGRENRQR